MRTALAAFLFAGTLVALPGAATAQGLAGSSGDYEAPTSTYTLCASTTTQRNPVPGLTITRSHKLPSARAPRAGGAYFCNGERFGVPPEPVAETSVTVTTRTLVPVGRRFVVRGGVSPYVLGSPRP